MIKKIIKKGGSNIILIIEKLIKRISKARQMNRDVAN